MVPVEPSDRLGYVRLRLVADLYGQLRLGRWRRLAEIESKEKVIVVPQVFIYSGGVMIGMTE